MPYRYELDEEVHETDLEWMYGAQLRQYMRGNRAHTIYRKTGGPYYEDELIGENTRIDMTGEMPRLYSVPPCGFSPHRYY